MTMGDTRTIVQWANQLSTVPEAAKLAVRLHLLSLLFEVSLYIYFFFYLVQLLLNLYYCRTLYVRFILF